MGGHRPASNGQKCCCGRGLATHLRISRIGVEHVAEELARYCHSGDNKPMHVVTVDDKRPPCALQAQFRHAVEVDEQAQENVVRGRAVLEDPQEVRFEGYGGDITSMERKGRGRGAQGGPRGLRQS